ncbi:hypothetical protein, partial [Tenacibaculum geojense]|uniref:hypothetical protein n=1 Tax=Tenacibaculum geojense TaxID=915352 RepID=UPI0036DCC375
MISLNEINAQEVRVIDNKGTLRIVNNNSVTEANIAPTNPVEGDVWFNTSTTPSIVNFWDGTNWLNLSDYLDNTDSQNITSFNYDDSSNTLTISIENGNTQTVNLSELSETVSAGTGISVTQTGQDFQVTNSAPDQTVTIVDGGNGNVTVGGTYPNFTIDVPNN